MNILGIETSCDETAAAVVKNGAHILSSVVASSLAKHKKYGGIIPEIASRAHIELIDTIVDRSLRNARLSYKDIDGIAVTGTPGLIGSLLVGASFARALSYALRKPLVEVDHIHAHLYANFLNTARSRNYKPPKLPAVGLAVSGGHTALFSIPSFEHIRLMGTTRDDAVGEAYDKVARILGLGYPGGPIIDRLAQSGDNNRIRFTCAEMPDSLDFSFSGIKTAVLRYSQRHAHITKADTRHIAYAFQKSVVDILVKKSILACKEKNVTTLLVGGGVAANFALRAELTRHAGTESIAVYFPPMALCLDNAAMVAGFGYHRLNKTRSMRTQKKS